MTFAKGVGSAHVPLGGVLMTDKVAAPFLEGSNVFNHGITFGGHPVACAVALREPRGHGARGRDRQRAAQRAVLPRAAERLGEKPIVGDVRGAGYFMSLELVKDKETKQTFDDEESRVPAARVPVARACTTPGLICRADDRGDPVIQLSPPLIASREELDYIHDVLDTVLDKAWAEMHTATRTARSFAANQQ